MLFKTSFEQLAWSLASYADHLMAKRAKVYPCIRKKCTKCRRSFKCSFHSCLSLFPSISCTHCRSCFSSRTECSYGILSVAYYRQKEVWLTDLKQGLEVPLVHLTYSPASNLGDLFWVCHCIAIEIFVVLETSYLIIRTNQDVHHRISH